MSKAIGPEFRGVFNKIEQQAEEYNKAFADFNKMQRDLQRAKRENEELLIKNTELYEKNLKIYDRLEKIENYVIDRMNEAVEKVIDYFEKNVIGGIFKKADIAIDDFKSRADELIEAVEGTTGLVQIVAKMRSISALIDNKIRELDSEKALIAELNETMLKEFNKHQEKINLVSEEASVTAQTAEKTLKKIHQQVNEAYDTAYYNIESKIKTMSSDSQNAQIILSQRISKSEQKIDAFLSIGQNLEQHIKNITNALKQQQKNHSKISIDKEISMIHNHIDDITRKLAGRIEKIEKKLGDI